MKTMRYKDRRGQAWRVKQIAQGGASDRRPVPITLANLLFESTDEQRIVRGVPIDWIDHPDQFGQYLARSESFSRYGERGPAWIATREHPVKIRHDGRIFHAWAESGGVSTAGPAIPSNAQWIVAADGTEYAGREAHPDDTEEDVRRVVEEVWRKHREMPSR